MKELFGLPVPAKEVPASALKGRKMEEQLRSGTSERAPRTDNKCAAEQTTTQPRVGVLYVWRPRLVPREVEMWPCDACHLHALRD